MTDEQIIEELKDEIGRANYLESYYIDTVNIGVFQHALDLISRQKAEKERLLQKLQRAKSEALMHASSKFAGHSDYHGDTILCQLNCMAEGKETKPAKPIDINEIKSEAIKEFAERLKEEMRLDDDWDYDCINCHYECKEFVPQIDNLVKQMAEVKENVCIK